MRGDLSSSFRTRFRDALLGLDLATISDPKGVLISPRMVAQTNAPYQQIADLANLLGIDVSHIG